MELLILKNGEIFTRTIVPNDEANYSFIIKPDSPTMPLKSADIGKEWLLAFVDDELTWVQRDRPLTAEERLADVENRLEAMEYPEWKQPTGAHDAYAVGSKVSYDEKHWISTADANVWQPGVYGWNEL